MSHHENEKARSAVAIEDGQWTLSITRVLNAPRELLWRMWTEPEHLMQWYCPVDFTPEFVEVDLRLNGAWRAGMRAPDGTVLVRGGTFQEIHPPERLVFTQAWEEDRPDQPCQTTMPTLVTMSFTEHKGKTEMHFEQVGFVSEASRDAHRGGWNSTLDHLEAHLARA